MDIAEITGSQPRTVISAHELRSWPPEDVKAAHFNCCGCPVPIDPKATGPGMRVQAHFATRRDHDHIDCDLTEDVAAPDAVVDQLTERRSGVAWPNRLLERPPRKRRGPASGDLDDGPDRRRTSLPTSPCSTATRGISTSTTAYSIRSFAAAYLAMTIDERRATPIELPDVDANRYQFAFKTLPQWSGGQFALRRVFHGPLRYTGRITVTPTDDIHIELHAGAGYDKTSGRFAHPWTIVIPAAALTPRQRTDLTAEFNVVTDTAKEKKIQPLAFALATPDRSTPSHLVVTSRAHVAFLSG